MCQLRMNQAIQSSAATDIQKNWRCYKNRKEFVTMKRSAICLQSYVRMWIARKKYIKLLWQRQNAATILQKYLRRHLAIKKLKHLREVKAATILQTHWRGYVERKQFSDWKNGAIIIQSHVRKWIARRAYKIVLNQRSESAIFIQKHVRGFLATRKLQYLKEEKAATTIQASWRCYSARHEYLKLKVATILLQSQIRMWRSKKYYTGLLEQRDEAAIILQKYYRRHLAMKKLISLKEDKAATIIQAHWHRYVARKRFLAWKQCVIVIQSQARKWIAMRKRKELLKQRKEAAIIIQKNIRKFLAAKEFQRLKENKSATLIQTFWRCRSARNEFLEKKNSIILLQSYVKMWSARRKYNQIIGDAIILQKYFRRHLAMKKLKSLKEGNAATIIQVYWRRYIARKHFLVLKKSTIFIQSQVRKCIAKAAYTKLQNERNEAAIIIQKNVRRCLAIRKLQYLKEVKAATTIQTFWRCQSARNQFLKLKNATIVLQSYVRMRSTMQKYKNMLGQRHYAAITIQKYLRRHLAIKELTGLKKDKSATTIQTYWRGYANKKQFLVLKGNTIIIQSHVRKWIAMTAYKNLLNQRNQAAIIIQKNIRKRIAMKCFQKEKAAISIQSYWRRHLGTIHILRKHLYSTQLNLITKLVFFRQNKRVYFSTLRFDKIFMM